MNLKELGNGKKELTMSLFSENLVTRDIGSNIRNEIISEIRNEKNIIILNFDHVQISHSCADEIFGKLVMEIGLKELRKKIIIKNSDEITTIIIKYVIARRLTN